MFVDASALVGILAREIDAPTLAGRVGEAERVFTSPVAIYEAVLGLARARNMSIGDAERVVANFLSAAHAEIIPITPEIGRGAISALQACQPYTMLPKDRYGEWKVIDLSFTPQDFSG